MINQKKEAPDRMGDVGDEKMKANDLVFRIIDFLPDATFVIDRQGRVIAWNQAMEALTGISAKHMLAKGDYEYAIPFYGERRPVMIDLVLNRDAAFEAGYVSFSKDGRRLVSESYIPGLRPGGSYLHNTASVLCDAEGNVLGAIESIRDITDKKVAEQALKENQAKYETLFRANPIWTSITTLEEGRFIDVNDAFTRITGFERDEVIGRDSSDVGLWQDPADRERLKALARKQGGFQEEEVAFVKKSGVPMTVLWSAESAEIQGETCLISAIQDITDRKKAEEALRQNVKLTATLLDALPSVAMLVRAETIVAANEAAKSLGGLPGRRCFSIWGKTQGPCEWCLGAETLSSGSPKRVEAETLGKTWEIHWIPIDSETYLHYAFDITEKRRAEIQLRQAQKMEAIGTLAGGIAHDFNNILGAIIGYAEIMEMFDLPKESPLRNGVGQILTAGRRARDLVKQILAFSRQGLQEKMLVDIRPIVKECLKLLRASLPTSIEIRQQIGVGNTLIVADPTQIHQVVMNLATNAGHAMEEKGGVLEVAVQRTLIKEGVESESLGVTPGPFIRLTVSDTGHGMTPRVMERIFDPYFTTKEQGKGTGLGLAVVHGIATSYGGAVKVSSEPAKGSTFQVFFPAAEGWTEQITKSEERPLEGKESILFVDDERSLATLGHAMLAKLGYQVKVMTSSLEALDAFRADPNGFDLLITDITMPQMTGDVLANQARKIRPDLPVIVMSGFSERMNQEKAKDAGIDGFISKPMMIGDLARSIREVLDKKKVGCGLLGFRRERSHPN
jgi:PAS domain S-box-containing protein